MAALYGAKYTGAQITKPPVNVQPVDTKGRVRVLYDTYDFTTTTVAIADTLTIGTEKIPKGARILNMIARSAASLGGPVFTFAVGGVSLGAMAAISTATDTAAPGNWTVTTSAGFVVGTVATADADLSNAEFLIEYVID